jgi:hypothetical protein
MNNNEIFGEFKSAPSIPQPSIPPPYILPSSITTPTLSQLSQNTNTFLIDNNILYKKLLEIEYEISVIKAIVNAIPQTRPIYYPPQPQIISPPQIIPQQQGNIPQIWNTPTNTNWKNNESIFK